MEDLLSKTNRYANMEEELAIIDPCDRVAQVKQSLEC